MVANLRDGSSQYSLLECVNYTETAMGNRMIRSWLLFPLTDSAKIRARQDHVALFTENRTLLESVRSRLEPVLDIERLAGRIAMDKAHPKDLQALRASLESWLTVRDQLSQYDFSSLSLDNAEKIIGIIKNAIEDDPPTNITDGGIIRKGWCWTSFCS